MPVDASGKKTGSAQTLTPAQLNGPPLYQSDWFYVADDGALTFWVPVNGAIGGTSTHPRSELREVIDPALPSSSWRWSDDAALDAELKIEQAPRASGRIVIGQVHGIGSPSPLLLLQYTYDAGTGKGFVEAIVNSTPQGDAAQRRHDPLASGIPLGARFHYRLAVSAGVLVAEVEGRSIQYIIGPAWDEVNLYFKAGAYIQDVGSSSTDGGQVGFYTLQTTHH